MKGLVTSVNKIVSPMSNLFLSTVGCFVFTRGYGLVAIGREGPGAGAPIRAYAVPRTSLADVDALDPAGDVSDCSDFQLPSRTLRI